MRSVDKFSKSIFIMMMLNTAIKVQLMFAKVQLEGVSHSMKGVARWYLANILF